MTAMSNSSRQINASRGFTLVEAAISTIIVAVMISAAISIVGGAARGATREREWRRGQVLAEALMAEVLAAAFADPQGGSTFGIDPGEKAGDRSTFDDIDDFDDYTDSEALDVAGNKVPWSDGWARKVVVENVAIDNPTKVEDDSIRTGLRRITVSIVSPAGATRTLVALKSAKTVMDAYTPRVDESRITGARISMQVGARGPVLVGGASLFNTPVVLLGAKPAAPVDEGK